MPGSGLCTRCIDGCQGNCEVFKASFRGREVIYPDSFGEITAGGDKNYPLDYSHLNIQGYAQGAEGLPNGVAGNPDTTIFPAVDTETEYGWDIKVKMKAPIFTGALGSTEIARKNWEHFAVGAAISGITLVCGENVCGIDPELELSSNKKVTKAPNMDRRIEIYKRNNQGYGEILVYYEEVKDMLGKLGLQQLMARARCFNISSITRNEFMSLTEEYAKVTGIPYLMDAYREEAEENSKVINTFFQDNFLKGEEKNKASPFFVQKAA